MYDEGCTQHSLMLWLHVSFSVCTGGLKVANEKVMGDKLEVMNGAHFEFNK